MKGVKFWGIAVSAILVGGYFLWPTPNVASESEGRIPPVIVVIEQELLSPRFDREIIITQSEVVNDNPRILALDMGYSVMTNDFIDLKAEYGQTVYLFGVESAIGTSYVLWYYICDTIEGKYQYIKSGQPPYLFGILENPTMDYKECGVRHRAGFLD